MVQEKQNETNVTPGVAGRLPGSIFTELSCKARKSLIEESSCLFGGKSTLSKLMVKLTFMFPLNLNLRLRFLMRKLSIRGGRKTGEPSISSQMGCL